MLPALKPLLLCIFCRDDAVWACPNRKRHGLVWNCRDYSRHGDGHAKRSGRLLMRGVPANQRP